MNKIMEGCIRSLIPGSYSNESLTVGDPYFDHTLRDQNMNDEVDVDLLQQPIIKEWIISYLDEKPAAAECLHQVFQLFDRLSVEDATLDCEQDAFFCFFIAKCSILCVDEVPEEVEESLYGSGLLNKYPVLLASLEYSLRPEILAENTIWLPVYSAASPLNIDGLRFEHAQHWLHYFTRIFWKEAIKKSNVWCEIRCAMFSDQSNRLLNAAVTASETISIPKITFARKQPKSHELLPAKSAGYML